jgi:hypothetical protein
METGMTSIPHHSATDGGATNGSISPIDGTRPTAHERVRVLQRSQGPAAVIRADVANAATGRHREAVTAGGITILAGGWLVVSPLALGYAAGDAVWNPVVAGAVVLLLALARVLGHARITWFGGLNAATGVWLLGSAFWLTASQPAVWSTWCTGVVVLVMAIWGMSASGDE